MTDQSVTPDREALRAMVAEIVRQHTHFGRITAVQSMQTEIVDGFLRLARGGPNRKDEE